MDKSEIKFLVFIALFTTAAIVNSFYVWVPPIAPIVLLVVGIAIYTLWDRHDNKA